MENKGFYGVVYEKSKEALQSETWNQVRTAMKTEIQHFTDSPEIQYFLVEKSGKKDNAYGIACGNVVREYLKTSYSGESAQAEVVLDDVTYKVLKRDSVTSFYDAGGNTLFDVENSRLAKEYEFVMQETDEPEESECQIAKQIEETGEEDLKCSGGIDEKCEDCEKASEEEESEDEEEQETEENAEEEGESEETEESDAVPMGTASLVDAVTGNIQAPTPEEIEAAKAENEKPAKERAKEKLEAELKTAKEKDFADPIIKYLLERCSEDEGLAADVIQKHKTWTKCLAYLFEKAKKIATGSCAAVRSDKVFEWAEDYYHKDDKAEEEKKAKKAAEQKKKKSENSKEKKSAEPDPKKKTSNVNPEKKTVPTETEKNDEPKQKKSSKDMDGQMDLFSLMGM